MDINVLDKNQFKINEKTRSKLAKEAAKRLTSTLKELKKKKFWEGTVLAF